MRPISPIVVCGPRLRTRIGALTAFTMMPTRPSKMKCMELAGSPSAYNDFARPNLYPLAMLDQLIGILRTAKRFGKPFAQGARVAVIRLVRLDNRVLT